MGNTQQRATQTQENLEENDQENGSIMTCEICIEPICLPSKKFKNQEKCAHPFCEECVIKYIEVKIDERVCEIKCPALNCVHFLDPFSVRPLIAPNVFDKWCDLLCENAVLGFERCYCPYRDCSVLIVNECGGCVKQSKCPKCGKMFCFSCKIAWHAGYRCEEGRELRDRNDVAFGMLAERRKWKRCPVCLHFVELVSGCSIVKCRYIFHMLFPCIWFSIFAKAIQVLEDVALTFVTAVGKRLIGIGVGVRDTIAAMCSAYLFSLQYYCS
ncbi:E3 ubiquitin-protein ligase RSL1-like isoform X1 [Apium graveolens]|uniref:E3 ubiquitin-protein ligase RSL1-like isoform X1 n=1 Tax=Apium graveolens TaxID=4045 RepID=UPI003D78C046